MRFSLAASIIFAVAVAVAGSLRAEWTAALVPPPLLDESAVGESWYRCRLQVPDRLVVPEGSNPRDLWRSSTMLVVRDCPSEFVVVLNGKVIIHSEGVSLGTSRRFKVPKDILVSKSFNTLVIHIQRGALTRAPLLIDYFNEVKLGPAWERARSKPDAAELLPVDAQPVKAFYSSSDFELSATPLDSTVQPIPGKRLSPADAFALLETDDDVVVEQLLHEPQVAQPTHLSFDARGRMWVSQYRQYPYPEGVKMLSRDQYYRSKYDRVPPAPPHHDHGKDIVSVHEDSDGDGHYDRHTNVLEGLNMANAALRGWGGIWVMHTPYLLFYPDADGDDVPDRSPEVRLQGFGLEDTHSVANGLVWGPDGWLYGGQGSTTISRITRPDVDPKDATGVYNEGCHVWRYHPRTKEFELFADGGGNIFGLSFDGEGRLFIGHNGGSTRGWHLIQGGQYLKQGKNPGKFGPPPNPYTFGELPMIRSTNPIPRFSSMSVVVGGTALPERLRDGFLCVDPLHHHLVAAERRLLGSSFETTDIGFPLRTEEVTFRPVYLKNAPDGSIVIADFCEEYIAHGQNYQGQIDPTTGRIYRLRGKEESLEIDIDLEAKTNEELVGILSHANLWHRQTAARLLGQRTDAAIIPDLIAELQNPALHPAVDALWAIHQMGSLSEDVAILALKHPVPAVRSWAIRLLGDSRTLPDHFFATLTSKAASEENAAVRCQILSTAGRLPVDQGLQLIQETRLPPSDVDDPFIPLMLWFVVESHCAEHADQVIAMFEHDDLWSRPVFKQHLIQRLMRRFAEAGTRADFLRCAKLLELAPNEEAKAALLTGFEKAFEGRIPPQLPDKLIAATGSGSLSMRIRQGDGDAIAHGLELLTKPQPERLDAIRAFGTRVVVAAKEQLLTIATGATNITHRRAALGSLQIYQDPSIAKVLAESYPTQPNALRSSILNLLVSRRAWAAELVNSTSIPESDFTTEIKARVSLHEPNIATGKANPTPIQVADQIEVLFSIVQGKPGDAYRGESIYSTRCGSCHKLFFKGGAVGPDLTRYQRDDLPTMLHSIVAPSAEIREGYETVIAKTADGRILSGFLAEDDANAVVLRGVDGSNTTLAREDIEDLSPVGRSLMPPGLLSGLDDQQLRDLFAYLKIPQPITK